MGKRAHKVVQTFSPIPLIGIAMEICHVHGISTCHIRVTQLHSIPYLSQIETGRNPLIMRISLCQPYTHALVAHAIEKQALSSNCVDRLGPSSQNIFNGRGTHGRHARTSSSLIKIISAVANYRMQWSS